MPADDRGKTVAATERTLRIIEALRALEGARISEISEHLDMSKSSIHTHLSTLENHEYVVKMGDEYQLGLRFLMIGEFVRSRDPVFPLAKPKVEDIANETGEVASLMAEDHGMGMFVFRRKGEKASRPALVGNQVYLHSTAGGKAILAHLPESRVQEVIEQRGLPRETEHTITDEDDLWEELERIRQRGVAFNDEEDIDGLRAVAAPVMDATNRVACSLSVYGPAHRLTGTLYEETIPDILLEASNDIQLNVAFEQRRNLT